MSSTLSPVTPGELLMEEFLRPMGISRHRLAKEIGVPAQRIADIVAGRRAISADTDLRLCRFFGLSDGYWLRAQVAHDTEVARIRIAADLDRIQPWSGTTNRTHPSHSSKLDRLIADGQATAPTRTLAELPPPLEPQPGQVTASEALRQLRDEERS